jgi:glycosyltransferase involved in cell wall biosynthesis
MRTLVIIPAFNEEKVILDVVAEVRKNCDFDFIVLDDASTDNTERLLIEHNVAYLRPPINLGNWENVRLGFMYALRSGYDSVVKIDGDGQHNPKYIADLLKKLDGGSDIIIGSRYLSDKKPLTLRSVGSSLISFFMLLASGRKIKDPISGMIAYSEKALIEYVSDYNNIPEPDTLVYMLRSNFRVDEVPVIMRKRKHGRSMFSGFFAVEYTFQIIMSIIFVQWFRRPKIRGRLKRRKT